MSALRYKGGAVGINGTGANAVNGDYSSSTDRSPLAISIQLLLALQENRNCIDSVTRHASGPLRAFLARLPASPGRSSPLAQGYIVWEYQLCANNTHPISLRPQTDDIYRFWWELRLLLIPAP